MGRKTSSYSQLIEYITKEKEKIPVAPQLIFRHNIFGKSKLEMENEFLRNESHRLYKRAGVNRLYHEYIAFHDYDRDKLTDKILEDLARKYFHIRNENALYVAAIHRDKDHVHIHFCVSGTEISGKSLRISKQEFNQIKKDLQDYQIQKYPQLQHSISDFDKKSKNKIQDKEFKVIERKGKSDKQLLKEQLEEIFQSSISKEDFMQKIHEKGIKTYTRGKQGGVTLENGRNLRFNNLGFEEERFQSLEKIAENQKSIESIREKQSNGRKLNRESLLKEIVKEDKMIGSPELEKQNDEIALEEDKNERMNMETQISPKTNSFDLEI